MCFCFVNCINIYNCTNCSRVRGKASLSPYLVLDADALIKYTFMVKHFVHSRKFIVLIPTAGECPLSFFSKAQ